LLVDRHRTTLRTVMRSRGFTDAQCSVTWARGQGPLGSAWETNLLLVAPSEHCPLPRTRRSRAANRHQQQLTPEQLSYLDAIEMLVCIPLCAPLQRNEVIGVLTLDDTLPPGRHLDVV